MSTKWRNESPNPAPSPLYQTPKLRRHEAVTNPNQRLLQIIQHLFYLENRERLDINDKKVVKKFIKALFKKGKPGPRPHKFLFI
jgi:hypothetical protein